MNRITYFIAISFYAWSNTFSAQIESRLPEPDATNGYTRNTTFKHWRAAHENLNFHSSLREQYKCLLLLRVINSAPPVLKSGLGEIDSLNNVIKQFNETRAASIESLRGILQHSSHRPEVFRAELKKLYPNVPVDVYTDAENPNTTPKAGTIVFALPFRPGPPVLDQLEYKILPHLLETFGDIIPIRVVLDKSRNTPEIEIWKDARGQSRAYIRSNKLHAYFSEGDESTIRSALLVIWNSLSESSK